MDAWASKGAPDHVWMEDIFPRMASLKRTFAGLTRCDPDELAITTNISIALATIASCLDYSGERRRVILSELDFPTDGHVWLAQERRGAELVWLRSEDGLTIPLEAYNDAIDERTAVVMVNRVLYRSSAIVDAKAICTMARERGALSFVDDYHGIGIVPLDLHDLGCDLYTAGTLKWLLGGPGMVFLYARRELLPTLEPATTETEARRRAKQLVDSIDALEPESFGPVVQQVIENKSLTDFRTGMVVPAQPSVEEFRALLLSALPLPPEVEKQLMNQ